MDKAQKKMWYLHYADSGIYRGLSLPVLKSFGEVGNVCVEYHPTDIVQNLTIRAIGCHHLHDEVARLHADFSSLFVPYTGGVSYCSHLNKPSEREVKVDAPIMVILPRASCKYLSVASMGVDPPYPVCETYTVRYCGAEPTNLVAFLIVAKPNADMPHVFQLVLPRTLVRDSVLDEIQPVSVAWGKGDGCGKIIQNSGIIIDNVNSVKINPTIETSLVDTTVVNATVGALPKVKSDAAAAVLPPLISTNRTGYEQFDVEPFNRVDHVTVESLLVVRLEAARKAVRERYPDVHRIHLYADRKSDEAWFRACHARASDAGQYVVCTSKDELKLPAIVLLGNDGAGFVCKDKKVSTVLCPRHWVGQCDQVQQPWNYQSDTGGSSHKWFDPILIYHRKITQHLEILEISRIRTLDPPPPVSLPHTSSSLKKYTPDNTEVNTPSFWPKHILPPPFPQEATAAVSEAKNARGKAEWLKGIIEIFNASIANAVAPLELSVELDKSIDKEWFDQCIGWYYDQQGVHYRRQLGTNTPTHWNVVLDW